MEQNLDNLLRRFWDLESLGIAKEEPSVYETFIHWIFFDGERYQVSLPWKDNHPTLPDNYQLCHKRLIDLVRRLKQNPVLLAEYDRIIQDQIKKGIVEIVSNSAVDGEKIHYLPHHDVVRQDKTTSKMRIVYDASARSSFGQSIFDILLCFRVHQVALAGDIEKAILMVGVDEKDRDVLRFLWTSELTVMYWSHWSSDLLMYHQVHSCWMQQSIIISSHRETSTSSLTSSYPPFMLMT